MFAWLGFLFGPNRKALSRSLLGAAPDEVAALLEQHHSGRATAALAEAVQELFLDDRLAERPDLLQALLLRDPEAILRLASDDPELDPEGALLLQAARTVLERQPGHVGAREVLVRSLMAQGQTEQALAVLEAGPGDEPRFEFLRAELLMETERVEEGMDIVNAVLERAEYLLEHASLHDWDYWRDLAVDAAHLRESVLSAHLGAEAVVLDAAARGKLDARAGVNHLLIGESLMAESGRVAESLYLAPTLDPDEPSSKHADGLRLAESLLRHGELREAARRFEALVHEAPRFFPGLIGLGAVRVLQEHGGIAPLRDLPEEPLDPAWEPLFPDWEVLTPLERRVVAASAGPLWRARPGLLDGGVTIRILPLDVRATDLPELAELAGERADTRGFDGIGGLADSRGFAVVRVADLLDTAGPSSWVFAHELAHELAHLALWHLPDEDQASFHALYEEARATEWLWTAYQQQNVDEFFACAYQELLRHRYRRPTAMEDDRMGAWRRVRSWFEALERG